MVAPPDDLPVHAHERLADQRARKFFTSDLSVSEFLLVKEAGFEPLGLVMGSSIYHVKPTIPQLNRGEPGCELVDVTKALYHARQLAMTRMEEEADELGADGIIGLRLEMNLAVDPNRVEWRQFELWSEWSKHQGFPRPVLPNLGQFNVRTTSYFQGWAKLAMKQWTTWCAQAGWTPVPQPPWMRPTQQAGYALGPNTCEFIAIGTAVRHLGGTSYRNAAGKPFQSDLSGQDFWMLIRSGYRPVGFVMGNCVYYVPPKLLQAMGSMELVRATHGLYDARELAIERLQDEAEALGATGIIGVTISEHAHSWRTTPWNVGNAALQTGEVIELFTIGTAVVPVEPQELGKPQLVMSANDKVVVVKEGEE
jgi:uncharacterized protein YbjQ (UPF0145 family)